MAGYKFRSILAMLASFIVSAFTVAASGVVSAFNAAVHYFDFQPTASDALALDRAGHQIVMEDARSSPFKAFIERAETHALFSGGGFHIDPGRATA